MSDFQTCNKIGYKIMVFIGSADNRSVGSQKNPLFETGSSRRPTSRAQRQLEYSGGLQKIIQVAISRSEHPLSTMAVVHSWPFDANVTQACKPICIFYFCVCVCEIAFQDHLRDPAALFYICILTYSIQRSTCRKAVYILGLSSGDVSHKVMVCAETKACHALRTDPGFAQDQFLKHPTNLMERNNPQNLWGQH